VGTEEVQLKILIIYNPYKIKRLKSDTFTFAMQGPVAIILIS
jgi:hypothetical protein